ncbi:MAG: hypothetical protein IID37_05355 [Planctomycetes bacterium]|nr:hypothetical protein [Planctomycetota bacterium]
MRPARTLNRSALALTVGLAGYAVVVTLLRRFDDAATVFNLAFFLLLTLNTYFSVSFTEAAFGVRNVVDAGINALLMIGYLAAPWAMGNTMHFFLCMGLFFCVAIIKYAAWLKILDARFFLRRKIIANACGAVLSLLVVLTLSVWGSTFNSPAAGAACALYAGANVWVLLIDPLYREG